MKHLLINIIVLVPRKFSKLNKIQLVPRTDTCGQVEYTKAIETITYKELGKKAGVTSG